MTESTENKIAAERDGAASNSSLPTVSIVIPMLNEKDFIERCISSVLQQDYPQQNIDIVVVDGMSQDGSREKVLDIARRHPNVRLLDNPARRTPNALNIGIKNARGQVVIILGAHTTIKQDFLRFNIHYMQQLDVKCVGGTQINVGDTYIQQAIGHAMGSPFGIPSAPYRFHKKKRFVDTVVYAAYARELFDKIGYFDEELHISEDAELNWRIRKAGYKIFYTPEIVSYYYPRRNIKKLIRQFFNYGILRVNVIKKHRDAIKPIHLIPPAFLLATIILTLLSLFHAAPFIVLKEMWIIYFLYLIAASIITGLRSKQFKYIVVLPIIFMAMHLSWGAGFLVGLFKKNT